MDLSKGGAQNSRVTWQDEAERLARQVKREKNSTASYKEKWEEVLKLYQECQMGYARANDSVDFSMRLANEHSGRANNCEITLKEFQNASITLTADLVECKNKTLEVSSSLETQTTNFTSYGRFLRDCRRSLKSANEKKVNASLETSGESFSVHLF